MHSYICECAQLYVPQFPNHPPPINSQSSHLQKYFEFIFFLQGVRSPVVGALSSEHGNNMANKLELANNMANMTKSNLDNIVGSLWQARQESSGSSRGDQVMKNLS